MTIKQILRFHGVEIVSEKIGFFIVTAENCKDYGRVQLVKKDRQSVLEFLGY